ncbi:MAG: response regulator, partial [Bacteroidota bacterium]
NIQATSELGVGTTFFITLPITRNAPISTDFTSPLKSDKAVLSNFDTEEGTAKLEVLLQQSNLESDLPILLLVEDNPTIIQILVACLEKEYQLILAQNGQEGIDKAVALVPDLIISDIMMPIKNGLELSATLKEDERTSHIPIILLTAKSGLDAKIEGIQSGADAYLSKPFDQTELLIRAQKLLELRKALHQRYRNYEPTASDPAPTTEDQFIQKVRQIIEEQMEDETFGTPQLCRAIGLSRSQLHRKLKALTGTSTTAFIRSARLHKAKQLLQNSTLNISEVGYAVGFKNPSYFSTAYLKEFGHPPSATHN